MNNPIPKLTKYKLDRYATHGEVPGGFLCACIENNAMGAVCQADGDNSAALRSIMQYIYCQLPSDCWGSRAKLDAWAKARQEEPMLDAVGT